MRFSQAQRLLVADTSDAIAELSTEMERLKNEVSEIANHITTLKQQALEIKADFNQKERQVTLFAPLCLLAYADLLLYSPSHIPPPSPLVLPIGKRDEQFDKSTI